MKPLILLILIFTACTKLTDLDRYNGTYRGHVYYDIPKFTQDTTIARRIVTNDNELLHFIWWDAPFTDMFSMVDADKYVISNVCMWSYPSCADSVLLQFNGLGIFRGDSLLESGSVRYRKWVDGRAVVDTVGVWGFRGRRGE